MTSVSRTPPIRPLSAPSGSAAIVWSSPVQVQERYRSETTRTSEPTASKPAEMHLSAGSAETNYYARVQVYAPGITDVLSNNPSLPELKKALQALDLHVTAPGVRGLDQVGFAFRGKAGIGNHDAVLELTMLSPGVRWPLGQTPVKIMAGSKVLSTFAVDVKP